MTIISITDGLTGETIIRDLTNEEIKQKELDAEEYNKILIKINEQAAKRQALLDKLGITEDEARLLLGGN